MTSRIRGYAFEVVVAVSPPSAVLADQVRSLDWRARRAAYKGVAPKAALSEVTAKLKALLDL
jgi:mRNA interferase MazF